MSQAWWKGALAAAAVLASNGVAVGADAQGGDIVVTAPRSVPAPGERSSFNGAPVITATVSIPVLYQDLNLSNPRDGERLMTRVERVAQSACKQLDQLFPLNPDPYCVARAVAAGKQAARALITPPPAQ